MTTKKIETPEAKHPSLTHKPGAIDPLPNEIPPIENPDVYDPPMIPEKS